jgi:hypothetical protein
MPKLNPVGIAVASLAFFLIGFLWYGIIFSDAWMAANGITAEDAKGDSPIWMAVGLLITIVQVIGLAVVLKWKGASGLTESAKTAALLWAFFSLPLTLYDYVYMPAHDSTLLMIDASHLLVGWVVSAVVLSLFK